MEALWDLVPASSISLVVAISRVFMFTWRRRPVDVADGRKGFGLEANF